MRKRLIAVCAVCALGFVVAGCGDDEGEGLTKSEFVAQANQICAEGNRDIDAAAEEAFKGGGQPSDAELTAFIEDTVVPETQASIDGVAELAPPEGDEDTVAEIVDSAQAALDEVAADPTSVRGSDPFAEADRLATDYGLTTCAA